MGVKVDRSDRGWEVAVTSVNLTDKGRQLFRKDVLVWLISIPTPVENPFLPPLVLHWIYIPDDPIPGRTSVDCRVQQAFSPSHVTSIVVYSLHLLLL